MLQMMTRFWRLAMLLAFFTSPYIQNVTEIGENVSSVKAAVCSPQAPPPNCWVIVTLGGGVILAGKPYNSRQEITAVCPH